MALLPSDKPKNPKDAGCVLLLALLIAPLLLLFRP
jgi:hypothetical protein